MAGLDIQIVSANIATYGAQAVDTFYVKDIFGQKIEAGPRQTKLKSALLSAIGHSAKKSGALA